MITKSVDYESGLTDIGSIKIKVRNVRWMWSKLIYITPLVSSGLTFLSYLAACHGSQNITIMKDAI